MSLRSGDFLFESGQGPSIGYDPHSGEVVRLYREETFSFRVAMPRGRGGARRPELQPSRGPGRGDLCSGSHCSAR